ncbi:restriction endonuclease subunit S [Pectobacterium sp. A5351]|uniref:restriction endonuclease subunit S n=1 Tax=Pectobacterium sp. A5351 TaxID=2914983 RepID=UPI00232EACD9|nr:restriction endonuclease subunit S [Pectobacterium sp. A5351]WCG83921.1 restriction endonuclease subunit S [Pectobacterium sp. A5351]
MMKIEELFEIRNGIVSSGLKIYTYPAPGTIPYLRPSSTQQRTISGWVSESLVGEKNIYPEETLFVSTNGEGSHSYSYVSGFKFSCNSDVAVLLPKKNMTLNEKIYYSRCITMNRYKFSYGRKPKGDRLKQIILPDIIPDWVGNVMLANKNDVCSPANRILTEDIDAEHFGVFVLGELFDIRKGKRLTKANMIMGRIPYVGASDANNGVTAKIGQDPIHDGGTISVSYNGSVAEAFYQPEPYWATDDVNVLYPKDFNLTPAIAIFICTIIRMEKYRFSYGRKWHMDRMRESTIKLPVTVMGTPDWTYMETLINSLPYSSQL